MSEINNSYNLDAHYTNNAKVKRPEFKVSSPPVNMPKQHLYDNNDANNRMKAINNDIYESFKKEENKDGIRFLKIFGILVASILIIKGIRNASSIFKKS